MSAAENRDREELERTARRAIRALPGVSADDAFRAALRERFISGAIAGPAGGRAVSPASRPLRRRRNWTVAALVAAVAACAVVVFWPARAFLPELIDWKGSGSVHYAGREFAPEETTTLAAALRPGRIVEVGDDARLDIRYGDAFLLQYDAGTSASLPDAFGGMAGRNANVSLEEGEVRIRTGPGFVTSTFDIATPDGLTRIVGTTVSVFRDSTGTCVCVLEGTALVGRGEGEMESVPHGMRKVLPVSGEPFLDDIAPPHRDHLREFAESYAGAF